MDGKEDEVAARLSNYLNEYNPEIKKTTPSQLIDYFYLAEDKFKKTGEFSPKIEYICKGIIRLIKLSEKKQLVHSSTAFRMLERSLEGDIRKKILNVCNMGFFTENEWNTLLNTIYSDFKEYIDLKKLRDNIFVGWKCYDLKEDEKDKIGNQKEYIDENTGRKVELQFGSIHSSKGRTHLSTLIVETKYYEYNLESILSWLAGKSKN